MSALQFSFATAEIFSQVPKPPLRKKKNGIAKNAKLPNQYFLFCQERRTALQAEHPTMASREVTRILAEEWKSLSEQGKAEFADKYQQTIMRAREEAVKPMGIGKRKLWLQLQAPNGTVVSIPAFCEI
jgi:hypothetical protein